MILPRTVGWLKWKDMQRVVKCELPDSHTLRLLVSEEPDYLFINNFLISSAESGDQYPSLHSGA